MFRHCIRVQKYCSSFSLSQEATASWHASTMPVFCSRLYMQYAYDIGIPQPWVTPCHALYHGDAKIVYYLAKLMDHSSTTKSCGYHPITTLNYFPLASACMGVQAATWGESIDTALPLNPLGKSATSTLASLRLHSPSSGGLIAV
jgi:hypothetical protein